MTLDENALEAAQDAAELADAKAYAAAPKGSGVSIAHEHGRIAAVEAAITAYLAKQDTEPVAYVEQKALDAVKEQGRSEMTTLWAQQYVPEHTALYLASPPSSREALDAKRYQRLRILGAQIIENGGVSISTTKRFTNLDEYVDADLSAHPSRGEAALAAPAAPQEDMVQVAWRWRDKDSAQWLGYGQRSWPGDPSYHYQALFASSEAECCVSCEKAFVEGDLVHRNYDGGYIHDVCCDPSGFVDESGTALVEPPRPFSWPEVRAAASTQAGTRE